MQIYAFVHFVRLRMNKLTSHRPPYSLWVPLSPASSVDTLREGIRWPGTLCEPQNTGTLQTVSVGHSHTDDLGGPSAIGHSPAESTLSVTPHGSERSEVMTRPKPQRWSGSCCFKTQLFNFQFSRVFCSEAQMPLSMEEGETRGGVRAVGVGTRRMTEPLSPRQLGLAYSLTGHTVGFAFGLVSVVLDAITFSQKAIPENTRIRPWTM